MDEAVVAITKPRSSIRRNLFSILVLGLSVLVGIVLFGLNEVRVQTSAVSQLGKHGAEFVYESGRGPSWLRGFLPKELTDRVVEVKITDHDYLDISSLSSLPHVRKLWIVSTGVYDIGPVSRLWELEELVIDSSPVRDLSPLRNLSKLKVLRFDDTKVRDLTPLAELQLEQLSFARTPIRVLDPISEMSSLQSLILSYTQVKDLNPLANLTDLRAIKFDYSNVDDLRPLENMKELSNVTCAGLAIYPSQIARLDALLPKWECAAFQVHPGE